ncbi:hypothetical protein J6590_081477 [Homalodisca vitripennis]|nr:hypothetical protein J6590_081477 [Homalodisca vitripennis]
MKRGELVGFLMKNMQLFQCSGLAISTRMSLLPDTRVYRALQDWPQCYELFVCGRIVRE